MLMMQNEKEKEEDDDVGNTNNNNNDNDGYDENKHEEFISLFVVYFPTLSVTQTLYIERFYDTQ
jgi:hypothetical protein